MFAFESGYRLKESEALLLLAEIEAKKRVK